VIYLAGPVQAEVGKIDFKDLVVRSDMVVVVTVTKVEAGPKDIEVWDESFSPVKVATARVVETWKGKADKDVRFVASPTWVCDISSAKEGEKRVLFLQRLPNSPIMMTTHAGRGGMLLHNVKDKPYAIVSDDVILPTGTRTISEKKKASVTLPRRPDEAGKKPPAPLTFTLTYEVRSIELESLRALVHQVSR
jgi:hypothetical protein